MQLKTLSSTPPTARKVIARLLLTGLVLVLIGAGALPALAQDTAYADPSSQFTATIPDGWVDESTPEYGLFTKSGVSFYLLTVEGNDVQAAFGTAVSLVAPDLASVTPSQMGESTSANGTWTQVMYSLPDGGVGISVAQSNASATVVLIVTADSLNAVAPVNNDVLAILASVSVQGGSASPGTSEVTTTSVPLAQGEITFPDLTGPHAVGRTSYLWTDDSRDEIYTPEEGDHRIVKVWVWYPAAPAADSEIVPYLSDGMSALFQQLFGVGSSNVRVHAYESAPVQTAETGYPVLVFSPGNGHNALFSTSLLEEVASHGYIVVGLDHTYNSMLTTLVDGQVMGAKPETMPETDENFAIRINDIEFVIDQLETINTSDAILKGSLDLNHLGVYGHSFGGTTAAEVCRMDTRCQATIVIDWQLQGEVSKTGLSKPIMLMDSERISMEQYAQEVEELTGQTIPEAVVDVIDGINDFRDTTAAMLLEMSPDAYRVIVDGARHYSFTDILLLAEVQPTLYAAIGSIPTIDPERGQRVTSDYILAFFDKYLKGEPSPLLEGASADYPEVTLNRHAN